MRAWTTQWCHWTIPSHPSSSHCHCRGRSTQLFALELTNTWKKYKITLSARKKKYTFAAEGRQGKGTRGFCGQEQKLWLIAELDSRPTETQAGLLVPREQRCQELLSWECSFVVKHSKALPTSFWRSPCPARASPSASSAFGYLGFPPAAPHGTGGAEHPWEGVQGWVTPRGFGLGHAG